MLSFLGFLTSIFSFIYGLWIIASSLAGKIPVPGYASIIVIISFFFAIVILYLSIIQEYLWRIYGDINKRAEVVVEKVFE